MAGAEGAPSASCRSPAPCSEHGDDESEDESFIEWLTSRLQPGVYVRGWSSSSSLELDGDESIIEGDSDDEFIADPVVVDEESDGDDVAAVKPAATPAESDELLPLEEPKEDCAEEIWYDLRGAYAPGPQPQPLSWPFAADTEPEPLSHGDKVRCCYLDDDFRPMPTIVEDGETELVESF